MSQGVCQRNLALLFEKSRHVFRALRAQLLVESCATDLRGIPFHLNYLAGDAFGLLGQLQKLGSILWLNCDLVITIENGDFP